MHVLRSTPLIHRRHVLRGLGTALALPLLGGKKGTQLFSETGTGQLEA